MRRSRVDGPPGDLVLWPGDMPRSVQDITQTGIEDEEGHDESVPVFDPVESDDDADSVIDALQRDLEGDVVLVAPPLPEVDESRGSTPVIPRQPRRLVLVDGSQGEDVESEARSGVGPMTDVSDTDSVADTAASEIRVDGIRVPSVEPDVEVRDPQVNS